MAFDRVYSDFGGELNKLRDQVVSLSRKVGGLERKLVYLKNELEIQQKRGDEREKRPKKRMSPEKAQKAILLRLKRARGNFVTSKELGSPLGIGRATVAVRVRELREQGYSISSSPRKGYALE